MGLVESKGVDDAGMYNHLPRVESSKEVNVQQSKRLNSMVSAEKFGHIVIRQISLNLVANQHKSRRNSCKVTLVLTPLH